MKFLKSLFILAVFSTPKVIQAADAFSTGTYVLTLPSTSTADRNKSWATKYNDNFQAIGTNLSNLVATDSTLLTWTSTATTRIDQGQVFQSTVSNYLTNGALAVYDEGTVQGNATTINFAGSNVSVSNSGSTATVTVTGSAGGGTDIRSFDAIVVGTAGTVGVDAIVTTNEQFQMVLSSFNMRGLTQSTTAQGKIILRNGSYVNAITTIPAGLTVVCESSAVLVLNHLGTLVTNHGTLGIPGDPSTTCSIDGGRRAFTGNVVVLTTGSKTNVTIYGTQDRVTTGKMLRIANSTGVIADVSIKDYALAVVADSGFTNDRSGIEVLSSSECVLNIKTGIFTQNAATTAGFLLFRDMWHSQVTFDFSSVQYHWATITGGGFNRFLGKGVVRNGLTQFSNGGFIQIDHNSGGASGFGPSTGTYINMAWDSYETAEDPVYYVTVSGTHQVLISGTIFEHSLGNASTGVLFNTGTTNCSINDLMMWNIATPVVDSGTSSTLNYWKNGKHIVNN